MSWDFAQPVWTYWEGRTSPLIECCLDTLRRWWNVRVLDPESFNQLWEHERDVEIDKLHVAHRADFVRAYLLRYLGGTWTDADCIAQRPLDPLRDSLRDQDLVAYREPAGGISNNFLIARPGSPAVRMFYDAIVDHLRLDRAIDWLELGSIPLTAAIAANQGAVEVLPSQQIMPVCWSRSERFVAASDDDVSAISAAGGSDEPFCYMLSNQSLPKHVHELDHDQLLASNTLLGALLRKALRPLSVRADDAANYRYWQRAGLQWASTYSRRKKRHPYLHIAEIMMADYLAHHAPCRVLEWGCGTGRHLRNLAALADVEAHGFDQSTAMVEAGFGWAARSWRDERVRTGLPTGPLPYGDDEFDIVVTSEALLHTNPQHLESRLREFARVCRGHILHLESNPEWRGHSQHHDGCWGHDLVAAYANIGHDCRVLGAGYSRQSPYRVAIDRASIRWQWPDALLALYRRLDAQIEAGFDEAGVPAQA